MLFIVSFVLFTTAIFFYLRSKKMKDVQGAADHIVFDAQKKAQAIIEKAKLEIQHLKKDEEHALSLKELKLKQKEEKQQQEKASFEERVREIERKEKALNTKIKDLDTQEKKAFALHEKASQELVRISGMSEKDAQLQLKEALRHSIENEMDALYVQKAREAEEKSRDYAEKIIFTALQRISQKQIPDASLIPILLPDDDCKGKLIGKDGKNLRAFEAITGVTLIIDDAPRSVFLSSFDPMRRSIAKQVLTELISDGKVHPARIEELFAQASESHDEHLIQLGLDAAKRAKVQDLHPEIIKVLGKLSLRTSLSQNVLEHSIEVSHLMGLISAELHLNEMKARRIGLLHDIGKALDASFGASHAIAGYTFILKHGEKEDVANGVGSHHDEMAPTSKEAALCKVADALSALRPHARVDNSQKHFQKQKQLEEMALEFEGVDRAFAMQSGKELRVFVLPHIVDDMGAEILAKKLSSKIEESYSNHKIQIVIIRETKVTSNYS